VVRALLDTSVLIGAASPGELEDAISAASLAELHFGVLVARDPDERLAARSDSASSRPPSTRCRGPRRSCTVASQQRRVDRSYSCGWALSAWGDSGDNALLLSSVAA
jgi:hypothetical protein